MTCAFLLQENIKELWELNTLKPSKTTISSTLPLLMGHCFICIHRFTWNYAYSPFKIWFFSISKIENYFYFQTIFGRILGGFCAVIGVFTLTLPIPIVVNSFASYYKNRFILGVIIYTMLYFKIWVFPKKYS